MKYFVRAFKNYSNWTGRSNRKEWLLFVLFECLFLITFQGLAVFSALVCGAESNLLIVFLILELIFAFTSIFPGAALQVRRLHDVGKSGWWALAFGAPIISIYLFYLLYLKEGDPNINKYGPPPHWEDHAISKTNRKTSESPIPETIATPETQRQEIIGNPTVLTRADLKQAQPQIQFCRKCGYKLLEDSEFCSKCGTKVIRR